ncbi:integrin alpha-D [Hoplias malabaricus]|uniref:integrin alpha-D n=1 Tax=Hoplias malabaricus TaxID=27720 RepID=UPI00346314FE
MERLEVVVLLLFAACVSDGFNVDVQNAEKFFGSEADFFGFRVHQYLSNPQTQQTQILVSAPLTANKSGAIYNCLPSTTKCSLINVQQDPGAQFFGMSMAVKNFPSAAVTSCSPSMSHECHRNSYLNGVCYHLNAELKEVASSKVAYQECTKNVVNLVFMFDGSSSMKTSDFELNKKFIWNIVTELRNSSIQFAAVQFSGDTRTVFTFNDYKNGIAREKLNNEPHMQDLTNTYKALKFILDNHFNNVPSGADPEATKALVIITDGVPSDYDNNNILNQYEKQYILRFVIGVGNVDKNKLEVLASNPKTNNTFYINSYAGLQGLLGNLQNKIYNIEGDQSGGHRERKMELSQSGFSAVYGKDVLVLGAVGSNEWRGLLYEVETGAEASEMEIRDPKLNNDSYMGYSVAVGQRAGISLLFSGAPRSNHIGQVTVFSKASSTWEVSTSVNGEQVGSYFGASLCLLDLDLDGDTDFVVVGAPMFYKANPQREGQMYIYTLTKQRTLEKGLVLAESIQGQFAASVTTISDLNGDHLQDIAVGAPLEDDGRGAVYIYLGESKQGVRPQYTQLILAKTVSEQLQQFGVAIDAVMDMGGDGLTDIAVGARGAVILLKTRPVLSVSAQLSFFPSEINIDDFDCLAPTDNKIKVITLSICFRIKENTKSTGTVSQGLNVSYELVADSVRQKSRAYFQPSVKAPRSLQATELLNTDSSCFNHTVYMPTCVQDTLSPVQIRMNFSQSVQEANSSNPVLNIDGTTTSLVEIPFQSNCRNTSCEADLELDFSFQSDVLQVVHQSYFNISVVLKNNRDDSFNTSLELRYPAGLSLSKFETIKANRRTLSSCGDRDAGARDKTTCSISRPVYRSGTEAQFLGIFRIIGTYDWNETMEMTVIASSANNVNSSNGTVRKSLPVKFQVDLFVTSKSQETTIDFSLEESGPKPVVIVFEVSNQGRKGLPVFVNFTMPFLSGQNYSILEHSLSQNITECTKEEPALGHVTFVCSSFFLAYESSVEFKLQAQISFLNPQGFTGTWTFKRWNMDEKISSSAKLNFDKNLYYQMSIGQGDDVSKFHEAQGSFRVELIIPPNMYLIMGSGATAGLLLLFIFFLLLLKCGFFKRKLLLTPNEDDGKNGYVDPAENEEKEKDGVKEDLKKDSDSDEKLLGSGSENGRTASKLEGEEKQE